MEKDLPAIDFSQIKIPNYTESLKEIHNNIMIITDLKEAHGFSRNCCPTGITGEMVDKMTKFSMIDIKIYMKTTQDLDMAANLELVFICTFI